MKKKKYIMKILKLYIIDTPNCNTAMLNKLMIFNYSVELNEL